MTVPARAENAHPRPALNELTSLRFFAAFAVLVSHFDFLAHSENAAARQLYELLFDEGDCGVAFFYVLSGFIISYSYQERLATRAVSQTEFILLRIARIAPLHWLTAMVFLLWVAVVKHSDGEFGTWILNLLLLQSWSTDPDTYYSLNAPSWSLSNELFFYVSFLFLVTLSTRVLITIAAVAATVLATTAAVFTFRDEFSPLAEWIFYVNPVTRLLDFIVGMLVFRARSAGRFRELANSKLISKLEIGLLVTLPVLMLTYALIDLPQPFRWQLAYVPFMAAIVLVFSYGKGHTSRMLRSRLFISLGEASFALYLCHRPIITFAHQISNRFFGDRFDVPMAGALIFICIGTSLFVFRFVEVPIHRTLKEVIARFKRRQPAIELARERERDREAGSYASASIGDGDRADDVSRSDFTVTSRNG